MAKHNPAAILCALLIVQAGAFYDLSRRAELITPSRPLNEFPLVVGHWRIVREGAIQQDDDVLRADDYLMRDYSAAPGQSASLFIARFRSQRAGKTPHSPKNCLPGSGWTWSAADTIRIKVDGRAQPIEINRYLVSKADESAVVLYWYQSRDRVIASEFRAAIFTAWDAVRYNSTEIELVRVVSPTSEAGVEFVEAVFPAMQQFR